MLAMAPKTNIGSSTPINGNGTNIGSDLRRKVVNDAAASLRGLAKTHGRNAKWADLAVRKASNLTAQEALQMNVIDLIAPSLPALLKSIDGRKTVPRGFTLHTAGAEIVEREARLLHAVPLDADRPEHRRRCSSSRESPASASSYSTRASSSRVRSARSAWSARSSASRCCHSRGAG